MTAKKTGPSAAPINKIVATAPAGKASRSNPKSVAPAVTRGKARPKAKMDKPKAGKAEVDSHLSDAELHGEDEGTEDLAELALATLDPSADPSDSKVKAKPLRVKVPKSKERALIREFGLDVTALTDEEVEKRRSELRTLVKMGKTRGFLTQQEINDHLPEKLADPEVLEAIVKMLNDMGIAVYERAPDAATLLVAGGAGTASTDEEAEEAAEAALSTVDSEFGRTTDPVRMYMREMGLFDLLTREGEIEIAKRIEGGLQAMMLAISASPTTIAELLAIADRIAAGALPISDVVDGFVSADAIFAAIDRISAIVVGDALMASIIACRPPSMRLAISISPSRVSSSTEPISRMYMRTGSVVRPNSESTVDSAASAASSASSSVAPDWVWPEISSVAASGACS